VREREREREGGYHDALKGSYKARRAGANDDETLHN